MTGALERERNRSLLEWYAEGGRDLPWRLTDDPYRILVSEVMSQQTGLERVVPFYERFLERFPTVEALAEATFAEVATAWNGLGYNRRARRLLDAARAIVASGWPRSAAELEALPGVGRYTARAVACFAFGEPVAAVDTNLRRVLSRWHGDVLDGARLERAARIDLDEEAAAAWNHAMMDLGATVCLPRQARCEECPVESWCAGPGVYEPPRPQPRFEGSLRQVRGALVRSLVAGQSGFDDLVSSTGYPADRIEEAIDSLIEDDLVAETEDGYVLTD